MDGKALDGRTLKFDFPNFSAWVCCFLILCLECVVDPVNAENWFVRPRLTVRETYSDNINLNPNGFRQSALVTEIDPGFSVQGSSGKTQVNLNYQMQNIITNGATGSNRINHQLQAAAASVIEPNRLFINANSSVSQQNIVNTGRVSTGNLNNQSNRANVYTFSVNPTWTPRFDGYANALVRLGYDFVGTSSAMASNSNTFRGSLGLTSGYRFNQVGWHLGYNDSYSQRNAGGDVRFRNYTGQIGYNFNRKYSIFVQGGYFDNSFPNAVAAGNRNGLYYTLGASWTPSRRFGLRAAYGQNLYFINWRWLPTSRTSINLGFRHSDVGTNTGNVWNANITHQSARLSWTGSYSESTTTIQNILLGQSIINFPNIPGQLPGDLPIGSPVVTPPFGSNPGLPTFTNNILILRQGQISVSGGTGKSLLGLTLFSSRREDPSNLVNDNSIGASASWNWRFQPRTNSRLLVSWNRNTTNFRSTSLQNSEADFYFFSLGLTRNIAGYFDLTRGIFGAINYRYTRQDSPNPQFSYTENSVAATLTVVF